MSDRQTTFFMAFRDVIGGAFGGLVVVGFQRGWPNWAVNLLAITLMVFLAVGYAFHDRLFDLVSSLKENKSMKNNLDDSDSQSSNQEVGDNWKQLTELSEVFVSYRRSVVAVILTLGALVCWYFYDPPAVGFVDLADIYVSGALSLILISVYLGMANVTETQKEFDKRQTEIMEYQKSILESQHKPNIQSFGPEVVQGKLKYRVQNSGPGTGINGHLEISLHTGGSTRIPDITTVRPTRETQNEDDLYPSTLRPDDRAEWLFETPDSAVTEYLDSNERVQVVCEFRVVLESIDGGISKSQPVSHEYDSTKHSSIVDLFE
ncbi:hypothetical protein [Haloferax prahovense]|uniref:hypothetical protein n=1 Tax=Haloferax prahovense TaxID=381852 RepID=UPI0012DFC4D2|nr:hypothetical protein [Haloferax prahovense]